MNALTLTHRLMFAGHLWLSGDALLVSLTYVASRHPNPAAFILAWNAEYANKWGRFRPLRRWLCGVPPAALEFVEGELGPF